MKLASITRIGLRIVAIWLVINLPFGLIELFGRTKGVSYYPAASLKESEAEGILLEDMSDSVFFEGAIEGATFKEAWIEKDRKLLFVVSLVPLLWSVDIWSYPGGRNFVIKESSLGSFMLHGGAILRFQTESESQNLEGGTHYGNTKTSAYRIPDEMEWRHVRAVFYRAY